MPDAVDVESACCSPVPSSPSADRSPRSGWEKASKMRFPHEVGTEFNREIQNSLHIARRDRVVGADGCGTSIARAGMDGCDRFALGQADAQRMFTPAPANDEDSHSGHGRGAAHQGDNAFRETSSKQNGQRGNLGCGRHKDAISMELH